MQATFSSNFLSASLNFMQISYSCIYIFDTVPINDQCAMPRKLKTILNGHKTTRFGWLSELLLEQLGCVHLLDRNTRVEYYNNYQNKKPTWQIN